MIPRQADAGHEPSEKQSEKKALLCSVWGALIFAVLVPLL